MDTKVKINLTDYKYIVAFDDQLECYLCTDLDDVSTCVKQGLANDNELEAHILTFKEYKKATYKLNFE